MVPPHYRQDFQLTGGLWLHHFAQHRRPLVARDGLLVARQPKESRYRFPVPTAISSSITLPIYASVFDGVTCPSSAWIPKSASWLETSKTSAHVGISMPGLFTITISAPMRSALPSLTAS